MHQLGRKTIHSPNKRIRKNLANTQQFLKGTEDNYTHSQSLLSRLKRRSYSLTRLEEANYTDNNKYSPEKQILMNKLKKYEDPIKSKAKIRLIPKNQNQINSQFFNQNFEEVHFLRQMVKRKEQDLIEEKSSLNQDLEIMSSSENAKKLKLLRKNKDYQFYDNLVHNLLSEIKTAKNTDDTMYSKKKIISTGLGSNRQNKNHQIRNREDLSRRSMSNFKQAMKRNDPKSTTFFKKKRQSMIFRMSQHSSDTVYDKKIASFIQFLYKVNFSNNIYVDLSLSQLNNLKSKKLYKIKVGSGNNSQLVKSMIKRRFWLQLCTNKQEADFMWTQDTQKAIHQKQRQDIKIRECKSSLSSSTTQCVSSQQNLQQSSQSFYSINKRFTSPSYSYESNSKILSSKDNEQADYAFSKSCLGKKSVYPTKSIQLMTNHIPNNSIIGSKKVLFKLMHWYYKNIQKVDPFIFLPQTYHIIPGDKNNQGIKDFNRHQLHKKEKVWIIKPGQNTNRGNGIEVATTNEIERLMRYKKFHKNGQPKTFIVQKYLKPFLYNSRKFDIRHYLLVTSINGIMKAYWYKDGYIRTASQKYDVDQLDNEFVHLTNDAIQKKSESYGKYQPGNKISYSTFQRYLDSNYTHKKYNLQTQIIDQMKKMTIDVMKAGFMFMDPQRKGTNFELFGMDFMIDSKFKPYLIEINANPCLESSCPLLERLIPILLEHTFRLALDPLMPPTDHYPVSKRYQLSDRILDRLKYELIFDQKQSGRYIRKCYRQCENKFELNGIEIQPEQQIFDDEGQELQNQQIFQQC